MKNTSTTNRIINIKNEIRQNVIEAAKVYRDNLSGKFFIYIFENKYFILNYQIGSFMHLAGLRYKDGAESFYKKCLETPSPIQISNLYFDRRNPLNVARKKCKHLKELDEFIKKDLLILTDVKTENEEKPYPYVLTTIDKSICLGLYEDKESEMYYPKSLRIKGNIFDKPNNGVYSVDFIFSKTDKNGKFNNINFKESNKKIPEQLQDMIDIDSLIGNEKQ